MERLSRQSVEWKERRQARLHPRSDVGPLVQPNRMPLPGLKPKDLVGIRGVLPLHSKLKAGISGRTSSCTAESDAGECHRSPDQGTRVHLPDDARQSVIATVRKRFSQLVTAARKARLSQDLAGQIGSERANGGAKINGNMKAVGLRPKAWDNDIGSNRTLVAVYESEDGQQVGSGGCG